MPGRDRHARTVRPDPTGVREPVGAPLRQQQVRQQKAAGRACYLGHALRVACPRPSPKEKLLLPLALTRAVSSSIVRCELTHLARTPIDLERAQAQHRAYEARLGSLGCTVQRLAEQPDLPDAVFIEDTAVVLDTIAIVTRPGAASRRAEIASVAEALAPLRRLVRIEAPGTLDGGDVLVVGRTLYVGRSGRTNPSGIDQLRAAAEPLGYRVVPIEVRGCLHLKSAVTAVGERALLVQPDWVDVRGFEGYDLIEVALGEEAGANALLIGDSVVYPSAYRRTAERLRDRGVDVVSVEMGELAKAEGGVTCCSLIVETPGTARD